MSGIDGSIIYKGQQAREVCTAIMLIKAGPGIVLECGLVRAQDVQGSAVKTVRTCRRPFIRIDKEKCLIGI